MTARKGLLPAFGFMLLAATCATAQELPRLDSSLRPPPPQMLQAYLQRLADEQLAQRRARVAAIRTPQEFEKRRAEVREMFLEMLGGLPTDRSPLRLQRTGRIDRGDYLVEKIVYESLPEFYVTANLYIPTTGSAPYPAVLHPLGHSLTGKSRIFYQTLSIGLAKHGFVVLTYDPIGQGERRIFFDEQVQDSLVGSSTREHQMVGVQSLLAGESVARYRIWDGMRGIDLLESLPEVDADRIGITGCSGGGTLTAYIAALDERLKVAAPACYISSWEEQLEGTGPQDAEQQFPDQLQRGLNHADFVVTFAPKPYRICSTTEDFFPIEGARRTFEEAQAVYRLLGAEDRIDLFVAPGGHGIPPPSREAIYGWMKHWLQDRPGPAPEPALTVEYDETLYATSTGQVATSLGGETASTWNIKRLAEIGSHRPKLNRPADLESRRTTVQQHVRDLTRYQPSSAPLNMRRLAKVERDGYQIEQVVYDADDGRYVPALLCRPARAKSRRQALLYVDQRGKFAGLEEGGDADALARQGYTVLAIDLSGLGETQPDWGGYSSEWFGAGKTTWLALMVGRPLLGLRMADIVRGIDLLTAEGLLYDDQVVAFGKGFASVTLLHAAAIDPRIAKVLLEESLVSYRAIAETPIHRRIFDVVVPGVLGKYDLQDLVATMAPRPVVLVNTVSPLQQRMLLEQVQADYEPAQEAYRALNAERNLRIGLRREGEGLIEAYTELR